jgi:predicted house-cleaning noncanonical NTP pyrophosphatase (MazG superfamily)|tara:strand:+ start:934 stop:1380 length:447 start_codon:yes stop_codon:yes gene_type:complete
MRTKRDKIFDNTFDDGGDFELNGTISFNLNPQYSDNRDEEDKIESNLIRNTIHELIDNSRFKKFNVVDEFQQVTKLRKLDINEVYGFIFDEMSEKYSLIDLFSELCDYFNINPTKFYSSLSNKYKEDLIHALDEKTNVLKRKNINKLF